MSGCLRSCRAQEASACTPEEGRLRQEGHKPSAACALATCHPRGGAYSSCCHDPHRASNGRVRRHHHYTHHHTYHHTHHDTYHRYAPPPFPHALDLGYVAGVLFNLVNVQLGSSLIIDLLAITFTFFVDPRRPDLPGSAPFLAGTIYGPGICTEGITFGLWQMLRYKP
jgi:hypothetical protein